MTGSPEALQLENERLQRELAQARTELDDFTYSVSHDLRASLRHVNAYVQIIEEDLGDQVDATMASHLGTGTQAARHMGRQIDGLMALSRLAQRPVQWSEVDGGQLVRDVVADLTPALNGRTVEWQVAPDIPPLHGDAELIQQALTHLLSNACKFTSTRTVAEIKVQWQLVSQGWCSLTVADNGVGFNPQYEKKLFHAFQRLHGAREFEGLGMGLALTRKIVERHGGAVQAVGSVDAPHAGCRISITLPLA